jgi:hypothetical protein
VLENTVQAMNDWARDQQRKPIDLELHINAEKRGDNVWFYVWNSAPTFRHEDLLAIN